MMPPLERSRWRVSIEHPKLAATYAQDSRAPTAMAALGEVLHDLSMRHDNPNLNDCTEIRIAAVHR